MVPIEHETADRVVRTIAFLAQIAAQARGGTEDLNQLDGLAVDRATVTCYAEGFCAGSDSGCAFTSFRTDQTRAAGQ
jgi:hypothetical protein